MRALAFLDLLGLVDVLSLFDFLRRRRPDVAGELHVVGVAALHRAREPQPPAELVDEGEHGPDRAQRRDVDRAAVAIAARGA